MKPDRWQQIEQLYHAALERNASERAAFLDAACAGDDALRQDVESLLAHGHTAGEFMAAPALGMAAQAADPGELRAGQRLAHYRIVEQLGAGGMGEVYRARDEQLHRDVAIKVLPAASFGDDLARARVLREARAAAALNHPHICTIHEVGEADGQAYIAMELVDGQPLSARLAAGALPSEQVVRYGLQLVEALVHAHERGIIHRDLKSANVMVTPEGRVKLLDFGLAKRLSGPELAEATTQSQALLTQPGALMGTLAYMAPEQLRGQPADVRSDVWALGVVLYEMAAGARPFQGQTGFELSSAILNQSPPPLVATVPVELRAVIERCLVKSPSKTLEKDGQARYASAAELRRDLAQIHAALAAPPPAVEVTTLLQVVRRPTVAVPAALVLVAAGAAAVWTWNRGAETRWAREEAIPQIEMQAEAGEWEAAYALAKKVQDVTPDDPALAEVWPRFSWLLTIPSDPPGAKVFRRAYSSGDDTWEELGPTPLERVRLPFGFSVVRFELSGHVPLLRSLGFPTEGSQQLMRLDAFKLDTSESLPEDKVRVSGKPPELAFFAIPAPFRDFFLGKYEVTNREYKGFVDADGYQRREFWEHPFIQDGKEISWEKAMTLFTDKTGRPGPSTWEAGDYPEGRGEYPVSGVTWYEAAAYARFVGQELPTIHHRRFASTLVGPFQSEAWILPASNLDADGPAPVGQFKGVTWSGAYDMIGNVREWCFNAIGNQRVIAGGGWSDESAFYNPARIQSALPPLDRSATNGFRLAITHDDPETAAKFRLPLLEVMPRDGATEKLVSNEAFEIYRSMYAYDPVPLNAEIEATDSSRSWIRERVSFDSSYGERTVVYLYLPRSGSPPYQTLLYYPGEVASFLDSIDQYRSIHLDFVLKSGRAVAFPVFKGHFDRRDKTPLQGPNARRQRRLQVVNDLRRTVDYLATRKEIDSTKLGYYGYSTGGALGPIFLVVEPRLRVSVLYLAGLASVNTLPEVDPVTFLPRAAVPVLMFSGELDAVFPLETSAKPFFRLLGTPDKKHVIAPGGHFVPRSILIRETLDWLDRYLGPVK